MSDTVIIEDIREVAREVVEDRLDPLYGAVQIAKLLEAISPEIKDASKFDSILKFTSEVQEVKIPNDWRTNKTLPKHIRNLLEGWGPMYEEAIRLACFALVDDLVCEHK